MEMNILHSFLVCVVTVGVFIVWRQFSVGHFMDDVLFKIAYFLYTNTRVGLWYHQRKIHAAKLKHADGHSAIVLFTYGSLQITPIPCVADNYCYVINDTTTNDVVLVDVSDGEQVLRFLKANDIQPRAILTTHKHWDHCGGNKTILRAFPDVEVYGSKIDKPSGTNRFVGHREEISLGSLKFTCLLTPGHTKGHMVFLLNCSEFGAPDCLFAGDLLFLAGAGKMFEDSPKVMLQSLDCVCNLDEETLIWPGHEYANDCIVFATSVDNDNNNLREKMNWVFEQRRDGLPTVPTSLREHKLINPFLRTGDIELLKSLGVLEDDEQEKIDDDVRVKALTKLRERKDEYQKKLHSKM